MRHRWIVWSSAGCRIGSSRDRKGVGRQKMSRPVTSEEHVAAREIFAAADDDVTKGELRRRITEAVGGIRERSGPWAVLAESYDLPGPGYEVSRHSNEAEALTECIRLNRENTSDAGGYTTRPLSGVGKR